MGLVCFTSVLGFTCAGLREKVRGFQSLSAAMWRLNDSGIYSDNQGLHTLTVPWTVQK